MVRCVHTLSSRFLLIVFDRRIKRRLGSSFVVLVAAPPLQGFTLPYNNILVGRMPFDVLQ
jgi:hypothetical protein